jgi:putative SOS response-associated peptidase YedK
MPFLQRLQRSRFRTCRRGGPAKASIGAAPRSSRCDAGRDYAGRAPSRCLIPLTSFAEPEGPKGAKTRTWVTVKGQPIAAWAGLWRDSEEWGPVYSGAMKDCNDAMRPLHDRMPVLLLPDEFDQWLRGSFDDLVALQKRSFPNELIEISPTQELWVPKKPAAPAEKATLI